ncbi:MAG: serine hydrolase [Lutimonas sp.]
MKRTTKKIILLILLLLGFVIISYYPRLTIVTGFSAKSVASGMFFADRSQESIEKGDNDFSLLPFSENQVNAAERTVRSSIIGLKDRKAIFMDGLGATLLPENPTREGNKLIPKRNFIKPDLPFPFGDLPQKDTIFAEIDQVKLKTAIDHAFDTGEERIKGTRSVIVVYKDQIIGEKYAEGFDHHTPILGWSMTKSITATIYGILQKNGMVSIEDKTGIEAWQNDSRSEITYNDLLHMNSGLEWDEDYADISDVTSMLYESEEMGKVQLEKPQIGKINESWNYSSGTSNLLAGFLLQKVFKDRQAYLDFWYAELIDKIGMHSALIETDFVGNFVGSSYAWATTRDWAKFGLLYLHDGNWNGEQIFDPAWSEYVATPTNGSNGRYGAHFWLNAGGHFPDVPKDMYSANGFQGQTVAIIPSKDLVIVRMGLVEDPDFDFNEFLSDIINSIH